MNEIKVIGGLNLDGLRNISKLIKEGKKSEAVNFLNECQNDVLFLATLNDIAKEILDGLED